MRYLSLIILALFIVPSTSALAKSDDKHAGVVLMALGKVKANYSTKEEESVDKQVKLKRRTKIYAGYIITTEKESSAQIKLTDGTLINMEADSKIDLRRYHFDRNDPEGSIFDLEVVAGVIKAATGDLAGMAPDKYMLRTEVMEVTVDGTVFIIEVKEGQDRLLALHGIVFANMVNGQRFTLQADKPKTSGLFIQHNSSIKNKETDSQEEDVVIFKVSREDGSTAYHKLYFAAAPEKKNTHATVYEKSYNKIETILPTHLPSAGCSGGTLVVNTCVITRGAAIASGIELYSTKTSQTEAAHNVRGLLAANRSNFTGGIFGPDAYNIIGNIFIPGKNPLMYHTAGFADANNSVPFASIYPSHFPGTNLDPTRQLAIGPDFQWLGNIDENNLFYDMKAKDKGLAHDIKQSRIDIGNQVVHYGYWDNNHFINNGNVVATLNGNGGFDFSKGNYHHWYMTEINPSILPLTGVANYNTIIFFDGTDHNARIYSDVNAVLGLKANFAKQHLSWNFTFTNITRTTQWLHSGSTAYKPFPYSYDLGVDSANRTLTGLVSGASLYEGNKLVDQSINGVISGTVIGDGNSAVVGAINLQNETGDKYLTGTFGVSKKTNAIILNKSASTLVSSP